MSSSINGESSRKNGNNPEHSEDLDKAPYATIGLYSLTTLVLFFQRVSFPSCPSLTSPTSSPR